MGFWHGILTWPKMEQHNPGLKGQLGLRKKTSLSNRSARFGGWAFPPNSIPHIISSALKHGFLTPQLKMGTPLFYYKVLLLTHLTLLLYVTPHTLLVIVPFMCVPTYPLCDHHLKEVQDNTLPVHHCRQGLCTVQTCTSLQGVCTHMYINTGSMYTHVHHYRKYVHTCTSLT